MTHAYAPSQFPFHARPSVNRLGQVAMEQQRRRSMAYPSPLSREGFEHEDWDTRCEVCHRPLFFVRVAEQRLPAGNILVHRCTGCNRALWYASEANGTTILQRLAEITSQAAEKRPWLPKRYSDL